MIKHIWFDFGETIAFTNEEVHNKLRYGSYASVVGKSVSPELIKEYEGLYQKNHHSNAAVFRSLGLPSDYWSERMNSLRPDTLYKLAEDDVPQILDQLHARLPISIFSNVRLDGVLSSLGINSKWFTHILSAGMFKEPKPALDGYYKIVELSGIPSGEILYIGDSIEKDIQPAKKVGIQAGLMWKDSTEADYCFKSFKEILDLVTSQTN